MSLSIDPNALRLYIFVRLFFHDCSLLQDWLRQGTCRFCENPAAWCVCTYDDGSERFERGEPGGVVHGGAASRRLHPLPLGAAAARTSADEARARQDPSSAEPPLVLGAPALGLYFLNKCHCFVHISCLIGPKSSRDDWQPF